MVTEEFSGRFQIDLLDLKATKDGEYRYLLNMIDHCTGYCLLRPLKDKTDPSVAKELFQIFADFDALKNST